MLAGSSIQCPISKVLAANAKFLDKCEILLAVMRGDVLQQALALTDHLQEATASHVVMLVCLEVLSKLLNTLGQDADLHGWAAGIFFIAL